MADRAYPAAWAALENHREMSGYTGATLNYRPLRLVISIPHGGLEHFRQAVVHCTGVWGGAFDLIAVETEPGHWDDGTVSLIERAQIDRLVVLGENAPERAARLRDHHLDVPHTTSLMVGEMAPPSSWNIVPMGGSLFDLPTGPALPSYYAAAWGDLGLPPTVGRSQHLGYIGHFLSQWRLPSESPLARTAAGVAMFSGELFHTDAALTVVPLPEAGDVDHLCYFWNLRAMLWPSRNGVGLLPLAPDIDWGPDRLSGLLLRHIASDPLSRRSVLVADGPGSAAACEFLEEALSGAKREDGDPLAVRYAGIEASVKVGLPELPPHRVRLSAQRSPFVSSDSTTRIVVPLAPLAETDGLCVVDVLGDDRLIAPARSSVGPLFHERGLSLGDGIGVLIRPSRDHILELRLPKSAEVIGALLASRGIASTPSDGGRRVDQVISALGSDLARLPLKSPVAVEIVRQLAPQREARLLEAEAAYLPRQQLTARQLADSTGVRIERVLMTIDELMRARVLLVGTFVFCVACGLREWRVVDELATVMTCRGCLARISFGSIEPGQREEVHWRYRINEAFSGLISDGTAAVAVTLARLAAEARQFRYVTGRDVRGVLETEREIDGICCVDDRVVVFEARSSGRLDQRTVGFTVELARRLDATACFSTLRDWEPADRQAVQQAGAEAKTPVVLFAATDLLTDV